MKGSFCDLSVSASVMVVSLTVSVSNLCPQLRQLLPHAAPVGLRRLLIPLTAEGPGLGQGPAPLRRPSGLVRLLRGLRAERGPLQALVQLLFQLLEGQRVTAGTGSETLEAAFVYRCNRTPEAQSEEEAAMSCESGQTEDPNCPMKRTFPICSCVGPLSPIHGSNDLHHHWSCCFSMMRC